MQNDNQLADHEERLELILKELFKNQKLGYDFRRAYGPFFVLPWNPQFDGWIVHPKGKKWEKVISVTSDLKIKTYGKYFPTFSWEIAETLWVNFPKANVTINGQPIRKWSHVVKEIE